ncbi:MAG: hypothetical protein WCO33_03345 [bacterium]
MQTKLSPEAFKIIESYFHLQIASKDVVCPYFINLRKRKADLRALIGKGTAEEITEEVMIYAKIKGFDLQKASAIDIRNFMINIGIGIDCSGFVTYILNEELKVKGKPSLVNVLSYYDNSLKAKILRIIRPVQNVSANDITSELNTIKIQNLNEVQAGDLIRAHAPEEGMHVAIVSDIIQNPEGKTTAFKYVHSTRNYDDQNGMREGEIIITDPLKGLDQQNWKDEYKGRNWIKEEYLMNKEDSGIRRLKIFEKEK